MSNTVQGIKSTTQDFLEIEDIKDDIVLLDDGGCVVVIETTAVNFGLLSEKEQEALIYAYAGTLNSLSFPIQILLRSKHKDITAYLKKLEVAESKQTNSVLASRIKSYREFVGTTVKEKNVLDKKFYIVIPFSPLELGTSSLLNKKGLPYPKDYIISKAKTILSPKRDHLLRQLSRLGLKGYQLSTQQLIKLFHDIYNQESSYKPTDPGGETSAMVSKYP